MDRIQRNAERTPETGNAAGGWQARTGERDAETGAEDARERPETAKPGGGQTGQSGPEGYPVKAPEGPANLTERFPDMEVRCTQERRNPRRRPAQMKGCGRSRKKTLRTSRTPGNGPAMTRERHGTRFTARKSHNRERPHMR